MPELGKVKKNIYFKLAQIQSEIKVAKKRYNKFGGFYYRSLEDIFEELKPILNRYEVSIIVSDDIAVVENRIYIKATATLIDIETKEQIQVSAFARETDMKKGMDPSQITGAASSYARKYALAGLLLLDDNQDADTEEPQPQQPTNSHKEPQKKQETQSEESFDKKAFLKQVDKLIKEKGISANAVKVFLEAQNLKSFEDVATKQQAIDVYIALKKVKVEKAKTKEAKSDK